MKQLDDDVRATNVPLRLSSRALLLSALLAATAAPIIAAPAKAGDDGPVVGTAEGRVRGFEKNGVNIFLRIPYASPPVGDLRWRPPAPAKIRQETLDATAYASTCPQVTEFGAFAGPSSVTEDCLYLNVFSTGTGRKKLVSGSRLLKRFPVDCDRRRVG
jgi:para-nitrobenzyl esterase